MSKKIETQGEPMTTTETKFDTIALGILPEGNKRFTLVAIPLNSETKATGKVEVLESNLDRFEVESAYKVRSVKNVLNITMPGAQEHLPQ